MEFPRKPYWLKTTIASNAKYGQIAKIVRENNLQTICSSGRCPNMGECWNKGTATFMIGGDICTRNCKFCNTNTGKPLPLDPDEPYKIAKSIRLMELKYVVITSVDRDDLPDYGAEHWIKTIEAIRALNPDTAIEALLPDFNGNLELINRICCCRPEVLSHNMETVRRLTPVIRNFANYEKSLSVLKCISENGIITKSGIMAGLGEKENEILETMDDLLSAGCSILTIGQYLRPSKKNIPVFEYITPQKFIDLKKIAKKKGFRKVISGPLIRSSYCAENIFL